MSDEPKNVYDKIREEMRKTQEAEAERRKKSGDLFKQKDGDTFERLKGANQK